MLYSVETDRKSMDQVGLDLEEAAKSRKFGVLSIHNLKETMAKKGVAFAPECRIYEICNPGQAKKVLEADLSISTVLPCRISVYQEGRKIKLATVKPTAMIEQFGRPELVPIAKEIERLMIEIMNEAVKE